MSHASDAKKQPATLLACCECAKRETTWVRSRGREGESRNAPVDDGWKCLNCGKFRAATTDASHRPR